ncbi:MAG: gliding motility-associated C-terminal domain-containing protein [Saprospiraceae bacterium]|nr:gliding motility-associated C-terminal domain-containing protein [Saprospiraceae bacterium]MBP6235035.1 gliding motility-associated C-terminal domain-containing protein [Saprospiraceae bacterium]MBP6566643.1 gliding motility-associated C-terminal domain-containing protein [Saprospiraceae bacterium]
MLRVIGFIYFFIFIHLKVFSQPPICGNTPAMKSFCNDACIICDIDGFTGRNNSNVTGQAPPGFCTSFVHHMQWIGFIAGTTNLTLEVKVSNCQRNNGLEIGLYESLDCNVFRRVSECDTDVQEGETRVFKNTVPLVIGQYYYFVMDGSDNDICDWTIKVTNGSTKVLPLETPALLNIPDVVCQNEVFEMKTPGLIGATFYNWDIDGAYTKTGVSVNHTLEKVGKYEICLTASNVCDIAPKSCKIIEVLTTPLGSASQQVCFGECFSFLGKTYCESGAYEIRIPSSNGCDSIITLNLVVDDRINATASVNICEGDTLFLGNGKFFSEGVHQAIIQNMEGCNIYMEVTIRLIICNIKSSAQSIPVRCNGENTGEIMFEIDEGTAPFTYSGYKLENSSISFSGSIDALDRLVSITNVDEGNYFFTIWDNFGNTRIFSIFVAQPSKLSATSITSDYNGYQLSCYGDTDGYLKILAEGGSGPYTYLHTGLSSIKDSVANLAAGTYTSYIKDKNDCQSNVSTIINQPDSLQMSVEFIDPDCSGLNSGNIIVSGLLGGVPPYRISINEGSLQEKFTFNNLTEGEYRIILQDKNGCLTKKTDVLRAKEIPEIIAESEELIVSLGDSVFLNVMTNLSDQTVKWTPDQEIGCKTCLKTNALPINDTNFEISVTSKDGCEKKVMIRVLVDKKRSFTISNVLSPDNNGSNDQIRYFAGKDVSELRNFRIYDRWGNLIYQKDNQMPGLEYMDWDGNFKGQPLPSGVYTWVCEVAYIDQVNIIYKGTMSILR